MFVWTDLTSFIWNTWSGSPTIHSREVQTAIGSVKRLCGHANVLPMFWAWESQSNIWSTLAMPKLLYPGPNYNFSYVLTNSYTMMKNWYSITTARWQLAFIVNRNCSGIPLMPTGSTVGSCDIINRCSLTIDAWMQSTYEEKVLYWNIVTTILKFLPKLDLMDFLYLLDKSKSSWFLSLGKQTTLRTTGAGADLCSTLQVVWVVCFGGRSVVMEATVATMVAGITLARYILVMYRLHLLRKASMPQDRSVE